MVILVNHNIDGIVQNEVVNWETAKDELVRLIILKIFTVFVIHLASALMIVIIVLKENLEIKEKSSDVEVKVQHG